MTGDLDVEAVLKRRDEIIHGLDDSHMVPWLEDRGVTVVRGAGRIEGERRVSVGDDTLVARRAVVVATGSAPLIPPIDGLREAKPWTNREATTAKEIPERLAILGGGVVGVEMAQAYRSLGSQVSLIERGDRLIPREEPFASDDVEQSLRENGVEVLLGTSATAVRAEDGQVTVELDSGGPVRAEQLLVAIGRQPNTTDIGVETRRPRARQADRGERLDAGRGLALRDRRRERPRPAHPHGQVPGADRGRRDPPGDERVPADHGARVALAAGDLHRPACGGGRLHARRGPAGGPERARGGRLDPGQRRRQLLRARRREGDHPPRRGRGPRA